jgi:hypothetical protein
MQMVGDAVHGIQADAFAQGIFPDVSVQRCLHFLQDKRLPVLG